MLLTISNSEPVSTGYLIANCFTQVLMNVPWRKTVTITQKIHMLIPCKALFKDLSKAKLETFLSQSQTKYEHVGKDVKTTE